MLDMIVNFMKSPRWRTPINDFIDCHCIEFDAEIEENQHQWNDYHKVSNSLTHIRNSET